MLSTPIGRLRLVGMIEGVSWILLLFVAVPVKYLMDQPIGVKILGPIHGGLFMAFCIVLYQAREARDWPMARAFKLFLSSLVPFGMFLVDRDLREEDEEFREGGA